LIYKLIIPGQLPGNNEYIAANRTNRYAGAALKKKAQEEIEWCIKRQLRGVRPKTPLSMSYTFYESNKKRDHDNVASFAMKVVQDALVESGTLKNDGWAEIERISLAWGVDKENPRVEITLEEI